MGRVQLQQRAVLDVDVLQKQFVLVRADLPGRKASMARRVKCWARVDSPKRCCALFIRSGIWYLSYLRDCAGSSVPASAGRPRFGQRQRPIHANMSSTQLGTGWQPVWAIRRACVHARIHEVVAPSMSPAPLPKHRSRSCRNLSASCAV